MDSSNSYYNSGGSTLVKGTIKQSPGDSSTTSNETVQGKKLISGGGFKNILESDLLTFELSSNEKYLRKRIFKRIKGNNLVETSEEIYIRVEKMIACKTIKEMRGEWTPCEGKHGKEKVFEYIDSEGFITGWYKVRNKIKRPNGSFSSRNMYYKKREGS